MQFINQTQCIQSLQLTTARSAGTNASDVASAAAFQEEKDDNYFGFTHNSQTEFTHHASTNTLELEN
jgi:conjugal transfer/entry exclusion protein